METFDDFMKLDIRVGMITEAKFFEKARKPAYQLKVNFGAEICEKKSSAQITDHYTPEELIGKQILAVVNFPPRLCSIRFIFMMLICADLRWEKNHS